MSTPAPSLSISTSSSSSSSTAPVPSTAGSAVDIKDMFDKHHLMPARSKEILEVFKNHGISLPSLLALRSKAEFLASFEKGILQVFSLVVLSTIEKDDLWKAMQSERQKLGLTEGEKAYVPVAISANFKSLVENHHLDSTIANALKAATSQEFELEDAFKAKSLTALFRDIPLIKALLSQGAQNALWAAIEKEREMRGMASTPPAPTFGSDEIKENPFLLSFKKSVSTPLIQAVPTPLTASVNHKVSVNIDELYTKHNFFHESLSMLTSLLQPIKDKYTLEDLLNFEYESSLSERFDFWLFLDLNARVAFSKALQTENEVRGRVKSKPVVMSAAF